MKILYVLHQFFPNHHTGTERLTLQLAKQIQRMGNFVSVLTYEPNNLNISGFKKFGENLTKKEYMIETIPVIAFKKKGNDSRWDYVFDPQIEKILVELIQEFDIVHFMHPQRFSSVLKICKKLNIPTILTLTDNWLLCPIGLLTIDRQLCEGPDEGRKCMKDCKFDKHILTRYQEAKDFFENVDRIFTGNEFVRATLNQNGWTRNVQLNPFSIDYSYVMRKEQKKDLVFGFIGSLMWHKGVHVLIEAFKKVTNKNVKLKIYGRGAEGNTYQNEIFEMIKSDPRIEYCGTFEYSQLSDIMNELSAIIIPSTYKEIFPLVMITALAYKIPVVASRIGGIPEIIEDKINGYLFELGNVDELTSILDNISKNPNIFDSIRENIKDPPRVEEEAFSYFITYDELVNKKS